MAAAGAVALGLALAPSALLAQPVETYRLPGATVRPAPGAQGPVDRDNPVVTTTVRPTPSPTAAPSQTPTAAASQPAPTPAAAARPTQTAPRPAVSQPQRTQGAAAASAIQPPAAAPSAPAASDAAVPGPTISAIPTDFAASPAAPVEAATAPGWYWPWIAGGMALLAALFGLLWWRRRRETKPLQIEFERPVVQTPTATAPDPVPEPAPAPPRPPARTPLPEPQLGAALPPGLGIVLEARRMNASLMATTLNYVLKLTNNGSEPLSALAVEGDMVSAHASLPPEAQIANDNQRLELRHALVALAPGESAEFIGDFRLPLTSVTPIRAGEAAYFVPLARLRIQASTPAGRSLVQVQTYVVGELPEAPGAALKPFRLDLGPRTYSRVGQRAVN